MARAAKDVEQVIGGRVHTEDGDAIAGAVVTLVAPELGTRQELAHARTDAKGAFVFEIRESTYRNADLQVAVSDKDGRVLIAPDDTLVHLNGASVDLALAVPPRARMELERARPTIPLGPLRVDARAVAEAKPELALDVARLAAGAKLSPSARKRVHAVFPELGVARPKAEPLCYTSVLLALESLIERKRWPREIALEVDAILRMDDSAFATATYSCPNFTITYDTTQVDPDTSAATVFEPGSNPGVPIGSLPAGAPPTYIKRVCFWLERALAAYTSPPFSMRNPAAAGRIPVVINTMAFGRASPTGTFFLNNALAPDLLCAVAVHELFHMVQFQYGGAGTWQGSVFEGGAVFAEDTAADLMNRYLDEAGTNFNGIGVMSDTNLSLDTASYKCSLFWRYIAEQHSPDQSEPFVGVETYRRVIELCSAGSYTAADVRQAIRELPWYQDLWEFGYLDPARLDCGNAETTLGNYALACRLKDLGVDVPDRRFDFIEDEENIFIDDVVRTVISTAPLQSTLASVTLAGSGAVTTTSGPTWSANVNRFAHRYYEVTVDPAVTNVQVTFNAGAALTSRIFQIALIDTAGALRDIHRTDAGSYSKRITNDRGGVKLAKLVLVVTGADSTGSFTLSASPAAPAPDVMVTRWHSVIRTEYEIDSANWAWTWVSPDIWVDNDGDGLADGEVLFNTDNKLHLRLHNKGNATANGIGAQFWYQDASPGLSDAAWLPVKNTAGIVQSLSGLTLAAGASNDWSVDWAPTPSGMSHHFCIRAVVSVPGDPNTDNKRLLSNFGNVVLPFRKYVDLRLLLRNVLEGPGPVELRVVPRLTNDVIVEQRDVKRLQARTLAPGEEIVDAIRLTHRNQEAVYEHRHDEVGDDGFLPTVARGLRRAPDPVGHYPAHEETLPPGVAGKPLLTIVHEADGLPLGGVTYLVDIQGGSQRGRTRPAAR